MAALRMTALPNDIPYNELITARMGHRFDRLAVVEQACMTVADLQSV